MVAKVLGVFDIFVGICFAIFIFFGIIPYDFMFFLGIILLIKGGIFCINLDVASVLDVIAALIILMSNLSIPKGIVILVSLFLIQKGIFSMMD